MALVKNDPPFETTGDDEVGTQAGAESPLLQAAREAAAVHAAVPEESKAQSLVAAPKRAIAVPMAKLNPFVALEKAFEVDFNTFPQVQVTQGQFLSRDDQKSLGTMVSLELVSWQNQWQLSTGDIDDPASKDFLRYSRDGITAENGDNMKEILDQAKAAGFEKAKIDPRVVIVGNLISSEKSSPLEGKFVQLDLSKSSMAHFKRHQMDTAYAIQKGKVAEGANLAIVTLTAVAKKVGNMNWTEALFDQYKPA